ncbi:MAG TPA: PEP/pyruvate-binding domain-containing protein [Candidatus Limnocylindria bacterium]|nr:PEP/pyruvate-binding domain-containing protein [Candidatus Limnocylindria bacterium]
MTLSVRSLRDLRLADAPCVGGKAAGLGELFADGAHVPDGVVLSAPANGVGAEARLADLADGAAALGAGPFAVRSSGIAEDGSEQSFAGMFETLLDVPPADVLPAAERILASASAPRAEAYGGGGGTRMAVIVQRMVRPAAAGVALTADPLSGDRQTTVVTAVRGLGERLVSGEAGGDEWEVRGDAATERRRVEGALDGAQVSAVAREARRIADRRGVPQDVEWAIDEAGELWILQARPMTGLPPEVSWQARAPGAYTRNMRLGEWIGQPVTPLFESWLLTRMEDRMHALFLQMLGQRAPRPFHVVVNGWYFYSLNFISGGAMLRSLPGLLSHLVREPRAIAGVLPQTVRHSFPIMEREWREGVQPRYQEAVGRAAGEVEALPVAELPRLVDELADLAGEYFVSIAALGGAAYKMEISLAQFFRRHLAPTLGGSHLPLLAGFDLPADANRPTISSLDWFYPPMQAAATADAADRARVVRERDDAQRAAVEALSGNPKRLATFRRILADARHLVPIREEQVAELTIAWPVMRRAVQRIGEELARRGVIEEQEDVFFLTRDEVLGGIGSSPGSNRIDVGRRRALRDQQAKLVPPPLVGRLSPMLRRMMEGYGRTLGAARSAAAIVSGTPASAGRATGAVRVIREPDEFAQLQPGEILVAPMTAPAWTPLFRRAAAVVTDIGSPAAHASIIAREFGIPAVVGCGDATARLRTGMWVTVDGATGNVEPAPQAGSSVRSPSSRPRGA